MFCRVEESRSAQHKKEVLRRQGMADVELKAVGTGSAVDAGERQGEIETEYGPVR